MLFLTSGRASLWAQGSSGPLHVGSVTVSGSLRARLESWNWFGPDPQGEYTYPGSLLRVAFGQSRPAWDWQLELALPVMLGLPEDAMAPAPRGAFGLGANYFAANDGHRNVASLFPKQAFVRFKRLAGRDSQSLTIGRQEFIDGTEVLPQNETLVVVKRDRIAHRLIGNFGFTHVGRSLDGVRYGVGSPRMSATVVAARPTRGVFDVNGWGEVNVNLIYGALTGSRGVQQQSGEWRLFYLGYRDGRETVVKVDNRAPAARQADADAIGISTFGGHYLHVARTSAGTIDALLWGAGQIGSWGKLSHRAGALALEGGWQPPILSRVKPWIRGGYDYGSGDADPADRRHGTFFQVLPTPRVYARFPFFTLMNVDDRFGELLLRPSSRVTIRTDLHALSLSSATDLWYQGGGAFEPATFGYTGRPSGGATRLAMLYDVSVDATLNRRASLGAYFGTAKGHAVTRAIYSGSNHASFGYIELVVRF